MFCHNCGGKIPEGGKFCPGCGQKVADGSAQGRSSSSAKKTVIIIAAVFFALCLLFGGLFFMYKSLKKPAEDVADVLTTGEQTDEPEKEPDESVSEEKDIPEKNASDSIEGDIKTITRKSLMPESTDESDALSVKPCVPEIKIREDFSNVINYDEYEYYGQDFKNKIRKNGFTVGENAGKEFFETYEMNRYMQRANFVTVDSMMHTYHVYFSYLMRGIEKDHLYDDLSALTKDMLDISYDQYSELEGTEWEKAAKTNVAFFAVASSLLDPSSKFPPEVKDIVSREYDLIMAANGIETSPLTDTPEDYSQYKPRGYYEGDKTLEKYFRAMMWYGRRQFDQKDEDMDRSALLITLALNEGDNEKWSTIYEVTSFFAGASDDLGYCEYMPVAQKAYGEGVTVADLAGNDDAWEKFHTLTGKLRAPRINSIVIEDTPDAENVIPGYRFMGQRFTIDATIMQELVYRRVGEYDDDDKRMLPDFLDVPAALGSDTAYSILKDMGATKYKNYDRNLENMKKEFMNEDTTIWNASLYAGWLNTLRPLLEKKGEGYPTFMQNEEWTKKDLETFAGSYTELKHDTVLYSKQVMAEMGGGWDDDKDYRGYVEPEPLVYTRFAALAKNTADGLDGLGYLSRADRENLFKLEDLAQRLKTISIKELQDEKLSAEEFELIDTYGGEIEHFWLDAMKAQTGEENPNSENYPAALVVDIATDPNGTVLEMATGDPASIYVVVPVDGKLRIASGSVYSFYQFEQPISDRLTDTQWRKVMGISVEDYDNFVPYGEAYDQPEWTKSYRYNWRND